MNVVACTCKAPVAKIIKKKGAVKRIKLIINKTTGVMSVHPSDVGNVKYKFSDSPPHKQFYTASTSGPGATMMKCVVCMCGPIN